MQFISEAHSDFVGITFGILVSIASIMIILQFFGVSWVKCH